MITLTNEERLRLQYLIVDNYNLQYYLVLGFSDAALINITKNLKGTK